MEHNRKKPHYSGPRNNNNNNNNKRRFVRKPGGGGGGNGGGRYGGGGNSGGGDDTDFVNPRMRKQAQTNREKYLAMAKDALSSGDRVESEYYLQHADHYLRIMNAIDAQFAQRQPTQDRQNTGGDEGQEAGTSEQESPPVPQQNYEQRPQEQEEEAEIEDNGGAQLASVLPAPKMATTI